jgi:RND family efflux transporter MFP subunit
MLKIIKHHLFLASLAIIIIIGFSFYAFVSLFGSSDYTYESVIKRDIQSGISASGQVKAARSVDLGFERSGKVEKVSVSVGDRVQQGQIIANLISDDAVADRDQAKAALATVMAQASIQKTQADNSVLTLSDAEKNLSDKLLSSYTTVDDVVRTQIGQMFNNPDSTSPHLIFNANNFQLVIDIENQKAELSTDINKLYLATKNISSDSELVLADNLSRSVLLKVKDFVADLADALNNSVANGIVTSAQISLWKTMVANNRSVINTALTSLTSAETNYTVSKSASNVSNQLISSGTDLSVSEAQIAQAKAVLEKAEAQLNKIYLRAPFSGVITKVDAKEGQLVTANVPMISMISADNYQVDIYVSELQVVQTKVGDDANVTLDAYGTGVNFPAKVISIDPSETIKNGVASYKITVQFVKSDQQIKSGMNSNVEISISKKSNALSIPVSAVIRNGLDSFVVTKDENTKKTIMTKIKTGISDSQGYIEVTEGLNEGQQVAVFNK